MLKQLKTTQLFVRGYAWRMWSKDLLQQLLQIAFGFLLLVLALDIWQFLVPMPWPLKLLLLSLFALYVIWRTINLMTSGLQIWQFNKHTCDHYFRELTNVSKDFNSWYSAWLLGQQYSRRQDPLLLAAIEQKVANLSVPALPEQRFYPRQQLMSLALVFAFFALWFVVSGNSLPAVVQSAFRLSPAATTKPFQIDFSKLAYQQVENDTLIVEAKQAADVAAMPIEFVIEAQSGTFAFVEARKMGNTYRMEIAKPAGNYRLSAREKIAKTIIATTDLTFIARPFIVSYRLELVPPAYTGLSSTRLTNRGNLQILPGSLLRLSGVSNKPLEAARIVYPNSSATTLQIDSVIFTGQRVLRRETAWQIHLQDTDSLTFISQPAFALRYSTDAKPLIRIVIPEGDVRLLDKEGLQLQYLAEDDFGVANVDLFFRVHRPGLGWDEMRRVDLPLAEKNSQRLEAAYNWDFTHLGLFSGETVVYFLRAADNNNVDGPGFGYSDTLRIHIPSMADQLFAQEQAAADMDSALTMLQDQVSTLDQQTDRLRRELLQKERFDFQSKAEAKEFIKSQRELQAAAGRLQEKLNNRLEELEKQSAISATTLEKYKELQEMVNQLLDPELKAALQKMEELIDKEDAAQFSAQMQRFDNREFAEEIERMHRLLKNLEAERRLGQFQEAWNELANKQSDVSDSLANEKWQEAGQLEQSIARETTNVEKFQETLVADSLFLDDEASLVPDVRKLAQQIEQKANTSATQSDMLSQKFSQRAQTAAEQQSQFQEAMKVDLLAQIEKLIEQSLAISIRQQEKREETARWTSFSRDHYMLARTQKELSQQMRQLRQHIAELAGQTFLLPKTVFVWSEEASRAMLAAAKQLSQRQLVAAKNQQKLAQTKVNSLILQLLETEGQMRSSASGTGMESFMKMMQQMSGMQGAVNAEGMQLFQQQGRGQGSLQQLAARQRAVRDALRKAAENNAGGSANAAKIDQIEEEMSALSEALASGRLDAEIIARQQRLFEFMLDSQKSMRQQQFSQQRESLSARPYVLIKPQSAGDPGPIETWEDYFLPLQKEKVPTQSRKALREYYENLP
jgi:hypothetical protein